jgi:hypothetical protein
MKNAVFDNAARFKLLVSVSTVMTPSNYSQKSRIKI